MDFLSAVKLAKEKSFLIGTNTDNGGVYDEIIIMPTNSIEREYFTSSYIRTFNAQISIAPYVESDVEVVAVIDKYRIKTQNIFFFKTL